MKKFGKVAILFQNASEKGLLLLFAALAAVIIANSQWNNNYLSLISTKIQIGDISFYLSQFVNDFLMSIFFLVIGLEIKRELVSGNLSTARQRILPIAAATCGVIFPVLIYTVFNFNQANHIKGWAIPAATDIAFAIGILALLGKNLPISLRVFLTALAIVDDLIAICIIAIFYTDQLHLTYLTATLMLAVLLFTYGNSRYYSNKVGIIIGLMMWYCTHLSGVHATISGVLLGLLIPITHKKTGSSPALSLKKMLHPFTAYFILPLFAFINSGLHIVNFSINKVLHPVTMGIALGLFLGKQWGIMFSVFLLKRFDMFHIPQNATMLQLYGVSLLCGIGFTMSLFISIMSFDVPEMINQAQLGVFIGSIASAFGGALMLKLMAK